MKPLKEWVEKLYNQNKSLIENVAMPVILILWCMVKVNKGVDVSDSTYSLGNYMFADRLNGAWIISTYLSNLTGSLLVMLPFGNTLIGMNIYTGFVLASIVLICYFAFKNDFTAPIMFVGEFMAIAFCWIPTGILYNYLTYLFFSLGAIFIYKAVRMEKQSFYFLAGVSLGINVFVRIPNIAEMALIFAVWGIVFLSAKNMQIKNILSFNILGKSTLLCVLGYILGLGLSLTLILTSFGIAGIRDMVFGLFAMSSGDDTYTISTMLLSVIRAYIRSLKWIGIILAVVFSGTIVIGALKKNKLLKMLGRAFYLLIVALMIRFFWGKGMFTLKYYEDYTAMYEWGMVLLFLSWIAILSVLVKKDYNVITKAYGMVCLFILIITPIGSNNFTYQNLNNMFLILPFTLFVIGGWLYRGKHRIRLEGIFYGCNFPWMSMVIALFAVIFIQTSFFHINFVFRDGMDGTARDTKIEEIDTLKGIYTNSENAINITELYECMVEGKIKNTEQNPYNGEMDGITEVNQPNRENDNCALKLCQPIADAVFWGDCPGLSYIFKIPPAISTSWPDLDSYPIEKFDEELTKLSTSKTEEDTAIIWRKIDRPLSDNGIAKQDILQDYIVSKHLEKVFENDEYIVYR